MAVTRIPMTKDIYEKLQMQLQTLKKVNRPAIIEEIAEARAQGDISENAEYHAAKDRQGEIEDQIRVVEDKLARSEIINVSAADSEHVIFGATVTVLNKKTNQKTDYTLVSPDGVDVLENKISSQSPIGKGLIGKKVGDEVVVETPRGQLEFQVLAFR